ncbi:MAG: PIN domain-containing protein [Oscillospiraceae bacterium]|nr:PIN domain-containing protein [Oscillospiraceae bacterium]
MKMIFLVDGDNNIGTGLKGIDMLSGEDAVLVFYQKSGLALSKIQKLCAGTKADVQYVESVRGGKNSIDFQIITELGVLVGKREADYAYVISQDKGYAASIDALRARYADAFQEVALRPSIEDCLHLPFVLKAESRQDLQNALVKEYGAAQGGALYNHLKAVFQAPESAAEPEKAAKTARPRRNSRRKKPAAEKASE